MRKTLAAAATAALLAAMATPADAACGDNVGDVCQGLTPTTVSFLVELGTLTITSQAVAPTTPSAVLGSSGSVATIPLGQTVVKDTRSTATSWSMTATASDFTFATTTIDKANASFSVQAAPTAPTGFSLPSYSIAPSTTPLAADANGSLTLMSTTAGATKNGVEFVPVLTVTVPAGTPAGAYTGTVTQSVA